MPAIDKSRVLIIATDGFEQDELFKPREALLDAGARVTLASPKTDPIQGMEGDIEKAATITPDLTLDAVNPDAYDALVIPGGTINSDKMRVQPDAQRIAKAFFAAGKTVAAICHRPWLLAGAGLVAGRTMTSYESIRTDLRNAGANVVDEQVSIDGKLVTSRKPDDIPAFIDALIRSIEAD
ncbi:type 1 glutamine amidotransferase domain-containing protein [Sphingomonas sp.]|uniref:type 1 glutamine amidotransferase domain-containing protein n=1 Tax=Sphingomonas sp. TaxID=28214 RepID=UPI003AFF7DA4